MTTPLLEALVPIRTQEGRILATVRIIPSITASSSHSLVRVSKEEAARWGEEQIQLLEGHVYDYDMQMDVDNLQVRQGVFRKGGLSDSHVERGSVQPRSYTGLLPIILENLQTGAQIAEAFVEVRSAKLDYRHDYRSMLEFIAEKSSDLILDIKAPSLARLIPDVGTDYRTIGQRFAFVRHLLISQEFQSAVRHILAAPHRGAIRDQRDRDIRRGFSPSGSVLRQLASSQPRVALSSSHSLYGRLPTVPSRLTLPFSTETVDTPENRFVKFTLTSFEAFLTDMQRRMQRSLRPEDASLRKDIASCRDGLSAILAHDLFHEVSDLTRLPLDSSVLQKRSGYREVLQAWLKFNVAAKLTWEGGEDVYGGGKKDVATLYEYWLFFKLAELIISKFDIPLSSFSKVIEKTSDEFGLKLKSGRSFSLYGVYDNGIRRLKVRFSYNRTFARSGGDEAGGEANYPKAGSWTRKMRPDYTLSIWPEAFQEVEAEEQELMVHVHFDAKYRVEAITDLFGDDTDEDLDASNLARKENRVAKRDDLLKMHAYRDAIRRTEGAYVLYPGTDTKRWRAFHELLPGIGAFAISPNDNGEGVTHLETFLDDVISELTNRIALREKQSYHLYRIERNRPGTPLSQRSTEKDEEKHRLPPPSEQWVLTGRCASDAAMQSVIASNLYCVFVPNDEDFGANIADARYVLLFVDEGETHPGLRRVVGKGPRFLTRSQLVARGYGDLVVSEGIYGVFSLSPTSEVEYQNLKWDSERLAALEMGKTSRLPQTFRLDVILAACEAST